MAAFAGIGRSVDAAHAADWGLVLFVLSERAAAGTGGGDGGSDAGPPRFAAGDRAVTRLILENRGPEPLDDIRVSIELSGAVPVLSAMAGPADWRSVDGGIRAAIGTIGPGESVELPLVVELADGLERGSRGTGGTASVRASVPASGETLVSEVRWPIGGCADSYHEALRQVRIGRFADLRAAVDASRRRDADLPGGFVFPYRPSDAKQAGPSLAAADQFARARGLDPFFSTDDAKWIAGRLIHDLDLYLGQEVYPGLCTGAVEWTEVLEPYLERFAKRTDQSRALLEGISPAVSESVSATGAEVFDQGSGSGGADATSAAAALLAEAGGPALSPDDPVFPAADRFLSSGAVPEDRRQVLASAFGALERQWYLERALAVSESVSGGFSGTLDAIRSAHGRTCTCAD